MMANLKECKAAGIDHCLVEKLRYRLERVFRDADKIGVSVFIGSECSLRSKDLMFGDLILCDLHAPNGEGGAGYSTKDADGLLRGEL
jgi:hypothetical protein